MSTEIARKANHLVKKVIKKIAHESPKLADLSAEDLRKVANLVVAEELRDELKARVKLERLDFPRLRTTFLAACSRSGSPHTRKAYAAGLARLEAYCARQGVPPMGLTPAAADDWITSLKASGRSAASVGLDVAAGSAFYTWAERRHAEIRNPFRGTRSRPPRQTRRELAVPSAAEVELMQAEAKKPELRAAIAIMGRVGLRVGGLPDLVVNGNRWNTRTKGKEQAGELPEGLREILSAARLPLRAPFGGTTATRIADDFRYLTARLFKAGKLAAAYSAHDLRHFAAVELYTRTRDIYRVKQALGHASTAVSERYLRSLHLLDG